MSDHKDIIRDVYSRFVDQKKQHRNTMRIRPLNAGLTSSVYAINSQVIGKVSELNKCMEFDPTRQMIDCTEQQVTQLSKPKYMYTDIQSKNKSFVWEYLQRDDNLAKPFLSFPLHRTIVTDVTNKRYLVTLEPYIKGENLYEMLIHDKLSQQDLADLLIMIVDILAYLGKNFKFNHNDFHLCNIMVVKAKNVKSDGTYTFLTDTTKTISNVAYFPVIIDYDWATVGCHTQKPCPPAVEDTTLNFFTNYLESEKTAGTNSGPTHFWTAHSTFRNAIDGFPSTEFGMYSPQVDLATLMLYIKDFLMHYEFWNNANGIFVKNPNTDNLRGLYIGMPQQNASGTTPALTDYLLNILTICYNPTHNFDVSEVIKQLPTTLAQRPPPPS